MKSPLVLQKRIQERQGEMVVKMYPLNNYSKNLVLEIGCGHGHFLASYARAFPESTCIGIDLLRGRIERADKKKERGGESNLHFIKGDIWELFGIWPESLRLNEVWVLFPDPWPKKRHRKNRLIQESFLYFLAEKMGSKGKLFFRTDHEEYFTWTMAAISSHPRWKLTGESFPHEVETVFQARAPGFQSLVAEVIFSPSPAD